MLRSELLIIFTLLSLSTLAQTTRIAGKITHQGNDVPFAKVMLTSEIATYSDAKGNFILEKVPYGHYNFSISSFEFQTYKKEITVDTPTLQLGEIELKKVQEFSGVTISGKSKNEKTKEESFNVNAIDLKPLQSLNLSVNEVLDGTPGIRIRESGGTGSDFNFSLNGFTGKQVRFFIDGLPTDYLGQAYGLNIVPVNLLDRIEVYKGVVPVRLGADVLGGAVNLVTKNITKDFIDVSYSSGSFNTHKASVVARHTSKKNILFNVSGFYTYSDNNYYIDAFLHNPETGAIDNEPTRVQRFNDAFHSSTAQFETGVVNKGFADKLLLGLIATKSYKEVQQGANMTKVAGHVFKEESSLIPTLKYSKDNLFTKGLNVKLSAIYSHRQAQTVDTSSRIYDWTGNFSEKDFSSTSGELGWHKSLFTFNDKASLATATIDYEINKNHSFTLNNTFSWFQRQGEDTLSYSEVPFGNPNTLQKNFTGLSYNLKALNNKLRTNVFVKSFNLKSVLFKDPENEYEDFIRSEQKQQYTGYGLAVSYHFFKSLQAKASFENAYRLPEGYEIFGDGLLLQRNFNLTAEQSQNFNLSLRSNHYFKKHKIQAEIAYIHRLPVNMIRQVAVGVKSIYQNLQSSQVNGIEFAFQYTYNQSIQFDVNTTYQNMLNTIQFNGTYSDPLYLDRIPNIPYFFGNAGLTYSTKSFGKHKHKLSFRWHSLFVEEFYLKWPSQGATQFKNIIPRQIAHNLAITYSSKKGKYNISFNCNNITDNKLYDNFKIQKPGRNFNLKLRYFISK
mgnify:CR=1 FL=1